MTFSAPQQGERDTVPPLVPMGPRRQLTDAEYEAKARWVFDHAERLRRV